MSGTAARLVIRSELAEVTRLLSFIEAFCEKFGISDGMKYRLSLVAEELAVNVIEHGFDGLPHGQIEIGLERRPRLVIVLVEDEARPFNPLDAAKPPDLDSPLETRPIGGLGLHLIHVLSDAAEYRFERGRNVVCAVFADAA